MRVHPLIESTEHSRGYQRWRLVIGCHRGTLMSRDMDNRSFASLDECKRDTEGAERAWRRWGYSVWFATAYREHPQPEVKIQLHLGVPYY